MENGRMRNSKCAPSVEPRAATETTTTTPLAAQTKANKIQLFPSFICKINTISSCEHFSASQKQRARLNRMIFSRQLWHQPSDFRTFRLYVWHFFLVLCATYLLRLHTHSPNRVTQMGTCEMFDFVSIEFACALSIGNFSVRLLTDSLICRRNEKECWKFSTNIQSTTRLIPLSA